MRKLLLLATLLGFAVLANAQSETFHNFKVDIGFGYALPTNGSGTKAGATFTIQPHYRLSDELAIGLRMEGAAIGYENTATGDTKVSVLGSYCATGEYYFSNDSFRPFVGAGIGLFTQASASVNNNSDGTVYVTPSSSGFGAFPEVGFEAGHFRMSVDYNVVGHNNSYASVKIGFFLGGGLK